jgi:lysine 2,3-aminomutase
MPQKAFLVKASNTTEPIETSDQSTTHIEEDEEPPSSFPSPELPSAAQKRNLHNSKSDLILLFPKARNTSTSPATRFFRKKYFPGIGNKLWNDWHWQVSNRIRTKDHIRNMLYLSEEEKAALENKDRLLPISVTPYYMSLLSENDSNQPIRRSVIPTIHELKQSPGEADDPLGEEEQSPVPGLIHRYPDRVLFLVHDFCSTYCRYCTRSRVVGHGELHPNHSRLEKALDYIRNTTTIRDVLLSGGDPLVLSDDRLDWLLTRLRQIPHVEIIRIGTKIPSVLPQRVTPQLVRILHRHHPLWMSLHFIHPDECTPEAYRACNLLADAGIPLGSQTVLLKGINDNVDTMKTMVHHMMKMRVRPYYLYQCDPITGSAHFRTPIEKGLEIIRGLRGFTSGYAIPTYVVDAPGGGGKIPLMPDYIAGRDNDSIFLKNYQGGLYCYPDCLRENVAFKGIII